MTDASHVFQSSLGLAALDGVCDAIIALFVGILWIASQLVLGGLFLISLPILHTMARRHAQIPPAQPPFGIAHHD